VIGGATILCVPAATSYEVVLRTAQAWCDTRISASTQARVLDAGSGLRSYVDFPEHVHVTGVDLSQKLLNANPRLNERVHADLQKWDVPEQSYDCVVCWEVLEHLQNPVPVVAKLARAVASNGLLIVGSPNPQSIKGLITRFTPHSFHLWVYRRFFNPEAGKEAGAGPYRTFMKGGGGLAAVQRAAKEAGLVSVYTGWVESPMQVSLRERLRVTGAIWGIVRLSIRAFSLGRIDTEATDYVCIFERPAKPQTGIDHRAARASNVANRMEHLTRYSTSGMRRPARGRGK
jgi:SAM-dependent methyltransferase